MSVEALINENRDYIVREYVKAGGNFNGINRDSVWWALKGIYDREGEQGLNNFMANWKPHIPNKVNRGYA